MVDQAKACSPNISYNSALLYLKQEPDMAKSKRDGKTDGAAAGKSWQARIGAAQDALAVKFVESRLFF
ncbi:MAG: hypothetical protein ACTHOU_07785, partial [Aureliella sp.]